MSANLPVRKPVPMQQVAWIGRTCENCRHCRVSQPSGLLYCIDLDGPTKPGYHCRHYQEVLAEKARREEAGA